MDKAAILKSVKRLLAELDATDPFIGKMHVRTDMTVIPSHKLTVSLDPGRYPNTYIVSITGPAIWFSCADRTPSGVLAKVEQL